MLEKFVIHEGHARIKYEKDGWSLDWVMAHGRTSFTAMSGCPRNALCIERAMDTSKNLSFVKVVLALGKEKTESLPTRRKPMAERALQPPVAACEMPCTSNRWHNPRKTCLLGRSFSHRVQKWQSPNWATAHCTACFATTSGCLQSAFHIKQAA